MAGFETLEGVSRVHAAESRLQHAQAFLVVGVLSVTGFAALVAATVATDLVEAPACGLFLAAFAAIAFPTAGASFGGSLWLAVTALLVKGAPRRASDYIAATAATAGTIVFGFYVFAFFFGGFLVS